MKVFVTAASVCFASLMLASSGAQAQANGTYDVAYVFNSMVNSASDSELDGREAGRLIEDGFRQLQIRPNFGARSKQGIWIKFRLNYLYIPGTSTRVLSAVASAMNSENHELCSVDSNTWSQGGGGNMVRDAARELPRNILEHCFSRKK